MKSVDTLGPSMFDAIRVGDRVTIRNEAGEEVVGRAVLREASGRTWILNGGGRKYAPPLRANESNIVAVDFSSSHRRELRRELSERDRRELAHTPISQRVNDWAARLPLGWRLLWYALVLAVVVGWVWLFFGFWLPIDRAQQ